MSLQSLQRKLNKHRKKIAKRKNICTIALRPARDDQDWMDHVFESKFKNSKLKKKIGLRVYRNNG